MRVKVYSRIIIILLVAAAFCWAAEPAARDSIESTRTALEKWVETRRAISQEKQDWALSKEMLNERIELVQREITSLQDKIDQAKQGITEADTKRAELVEENEKLKEASETLKGIIVKIEARTIELNKRLPNPLSEHIRPLSQLLPADPSQTKLSISQRFQNVIGILNEINKFNREITPTSEVRTLADGSAAEVTTVYIGLGQAYYVGANGTVAGVGRPSENGWSWEPVNDAAGEITDVISIMKNEKVASFVPLPVKVQ